MRLRAGAWGLLVGLFGAGAAGCGDRGEAEAESAVEARDEEVAAFDPALAVHLPPNVTAEQADEGRQLYIVCASCHGLDARGTALGPPLRDSEWIGISGAYEEIQQVIVNGVAEPEEFPIPMPPGGGGEFTPEQVDHIAAYVFALSRAGG